MFQRTFTNLEGQLPPALTLLHHTVTNSVSVSKWSRRVTTGGATCSPTQAFLVQEAAGAASADTPSENGPSERATGPGRCPGQEAALPEPPARRAIPHGGELPPLSASPQPTLPDPDPGPLPAPDRPAPAGHPAAHPGAPPLPSQRKSPPRRRRNLYQKGLEASSSGSTTSASHSAGSWAGSGAVGRAGFMGTARCGSHWPSSGREPASRSAPPPSVIRAGSTTPKRNSMSGGGGVRLRGSLLPSAAPPGPHFRTAAGGRARARRPVGGTIAAAAEPGGGRGAGGTSQITVGS